MTRTRKVLSVLLIIVALVLVAGAVTLSHNSACGTAPALPSTAQTYKAIVYRCYGSSEVLKVEDIERVVPADNEVVVKVHAASVNPLDWHYMRGTPYIMRMDAGLGAPTSTRLGVDYSGTVEAVGKGVTEFKVGDEVFGGKKGAFGEYVNVPIDRVVIVPKPANVSFEQAASTPIAAITALQALRDKGKLQAGQKVLINGASGGVGTFAVQIAKSFGAEVTAVCSTRNVDMVRSIGADHVIDYTKEDFMKSGQRYDLILDNVGNRPLLDYRKVMNADSTFIIVGGPSEGNWLGAMTVPLKAWVMSPFVSQKYQFFLADLNKEDLNLIADLMQTGKVTPVIDRRYKLSQVPEAIAYLEEGHARGKVVIEME
jgi:NADPH:quinone reductase-like Zn-dependent oxidoreductase